MGGAAPTGAPAFTGSFGNWYVAAAALLLMPLCLGQGAKHPPLQTLASAAGLGLHKEFADKLMRLQTTK